MDRKTVSIPSMSCGHCLAAITRELSAIEGVRRVEGDPKTKQVTVVWQPPATWEAISSALASIGFAPA